jgi:hypothetical protein
MSEDDGLDRSPGEPGVRAFARFAEVVERVIGFALGATACYVIVNGICSRLRCATDGPAGLIFYAGGVIGGAVAYGIFKALTRAHLDRPGIRLVINAGAAAVIVGCLVLPLRQSHQVQEALNTQAVTERQAAEAESQVRERAWLEQMRAAGAHGPPGAVPPSLQVEQSDAGVVITNTAQQPLTVALARVREDTAAPGGWRACPMHTAGSRGTNMRYYHYSLKPGESTTYVALEPCAEAFRNAPIEYRVGRYPGDTAWWSDSAFSAPKGREYADGK